MTQKKKSVKSSDRHGNTEVQGQQMKKKKSIIINRKKANLLNNQISNGEGKFNLFKQISNGEGKFNISRCQQKKKSVPICKGKKSIMEPSTEQMDVDQVTGIHFKEEIMMEILSRLPVRSLLRFKCVSKFWEALIADPYFKKKHHIHAKSDQNSKKVLLSQFGISGNDFKFHCSSLPPLQMLEDEPKVDCPSNCIPVNFLPFCSYDGLVLTLSLPEDPRPLLLWNPSIRESIELPRPGCGMSCTLWGLGYDAASDDYKILVVDLDPLIYPSVSVEILSLKSGSWRRIGNYPNGVSRVSCFKDFGMDYLPFLHGAFHWLGMSEYDTIVSLNISNEVYGKIPMLEQMYNTFQRVTIDHGVSVLGGMLCVYCTINNCLLRTFKLWVMKDYGVKESWTALINMRTRDPFYFIRPKHLFADGEVLLCCGRKRSRGTVIRTISRGSLGLWPHCETLKAAFVYSESLISPKLLT